MIKVDKYSLTWNSKKIAELEKFNLSPKAGSLLSKYGNKILNEAKPKLPVASQHKNSKVPRLKDAMISTQPKIKKKRRKGQTAEVQFVQIKPKKRQKYYFVVMSGKNTYNGIKRNINYSSSSAESFPVEKASKKYQKFLKDEFISEYKKIIKKM